jgi:hypothetical protein
MGHVNHNASAVYLFPTNAGRRTARLHESHKAASARLQALVAARMRHERRLLAYVECNKLPHRKE